MTSKVDKQLSNEHVILFEKLLNCLSIKNYTVAFSPGTAAGENFMGIITQAEVNWHDNGNPLTSHFIIKCAPPGETFRKLVYLEDTYEREIYIYSKVLYEFSKFQETKGILAPFKSYPVFYQSSMNYKHEMLIFENMKSHGFIHWKRGQPLDFDHTLLLLQELGRLHALSYAMRDHKPTMFQEIASNTHEAFMKDFSVEDMHKTVSLRVTQAVNALDPIKDETVYKKMSSFAQHMWEIIPKLLDANSAKQYAVVGHGDCGISNYLFKYKEQSMTPTEVCILDWQMSRLGSPALDLSCILFACIDKKLRDQHYDHLINEYYRSLCTFLRTLGSDGQKLLPFKVLQRHLKEFGAFGLFMAIFLIYAQTTNTQEVPELFKDAQNTSFGYSVKDEDNFKVTVRDAILDFDKFSYNYWC